MSTQVTISQRPLCDRSDDLQAGLGRPPTLPRQCDHQLAFDDRQCPLAMKALC
ncbi:hypothetical protein D918_05006 [Trichuris suis]|nr:hypothetical protein D918_05006 [Trichuris suis]